MERFTQKIIVMNKNLIKVWALGSLLVATACSKSANEVITEDPSYKIGANEVYVDKPAKFEYSTDNFASNVSSSTVTLHASINESTATLDASEISFTVKLRRPLSKAMNLTLVQDNALLSKYTGNKTGIQDLPEGTLAGELSFSIPAGVTSHTVTLSTEKLSIKNAAQLTNAKGYIGAYRLSASEGSEAKVSAVSSAIYVKLELAITKVKALDKKDASWKELSYGTDFILTDGTNTDGFDKMADNNEDTFKEILEGEYLSIMSGSNGTQPTVSGLEIHVAKGSDLQNLSAIAYYDDDADEVIGSITLSESKSVIYVKFLKPIKAYAISLYNMFGAESANVKISEIKVYTSAK